MALTDSNTLETAYLSLNGLKVIFSSSLTETRSHFLILVWSSSNPIKEWGKFSLLFSSGT